MVGKDGDGFPEPKECIMIFGGSDAIWTKRQHKVRYREACAAETAVPSFLSWSESPITFDQRDHPSCVARPGRYPLVVDPIVRKKRLTKVLMDRAVASTSCTSTPLMPCASPNRSSTRWAPPSTG